MLAVCDAFPAGTARLCGHVAATWGMQKALVAALEGGLYELPAPNHLAGRFAVGDPVAIFVDPQGNPLGWILSRIGRGGLLAEPGTRS